MTDKYNKYFKTTNLVHMIEELGITGESFLILNSLDNIPSAIRYVNSTLSRKQVSASISKVQFIWDDSVITGLYLKKRDV